MKNVEDFSMLNYKQLKVSFSPHQYQSQIKFMSESIAAIIFHSHLVFFKATFPENAVLLQNSFEGVEVLSLDRHFKATAFLVTQ